MGAMEGMGENPCVYGIVSKNDNNKEGINY